MSIGIAIEGLMNNNDMPVKDVDTAISEYEIAAQEAELEMLEAENEMTELEAATEMLNIDLAILEGAKKFIEEVGICKNLVELVDPMGVLREYNIFPAVENLNDVPTKDENAQIAVEGIKEALSKAWDAIKRFFKKLGSIISRFVRSIIDATKSKEKLIIALEERLNKAENDVNEEVWKNKKITVVNKDLIDDDKQVSDAITKIVSKLGDVIKICSDKLNVPSDDNDLVDKIATKVDLAMDADAIKTLIPKLNAAKNDISKALEDSGSYKEKSELAKVGQFIIGKKEAELVVTKSSLSLTFITPVDKRFEKVTASEKIKAGEAKDIAKKKLQAAKELAKQVYKLDQLKDLADKSLKALVDIEKQSAKLESDQKKANASLKYAKVVRDINRVYVKVVTAVSKTLNQLINVDIAFAKAVLASIKSE